MKWLKKGLIFTPSGQFNWMNSHAQVPTVLLKDDCLRVYFATRPKKNLSLTTYVDLDKENLQNIIYLHPKPILELGSLNEFDEHGIMPSSVVEKDGLIYLYYSGWQRSKHVPYNNYTGLAISEDGGHTFVKHKNNPILHKNEDEPYSATSPCVFHHAGIWHMWYGSGTNWLNIRGKLEHTYDIKSAYSENGLDWERSRTTTIKQRSKYEAITKPTVICHDKAFHMWFCYRGSTHFRDGNDSYRIGYAVSDDLKNWIRMDSAAGIDVSDTGWDSKMIAYPDVKEINGRINLIYNGNNFGTNGFGYAVLQSQ